MTSNPKRPFCTYVRPVPFSYSRPPSIGSGSGDPGAPPAEHRAPRAYCNSSGLDARSSKPRRTRVSIGELLSSEDGVLEEPQFRYIWTCTVIVRTQRCTSPVRTYVRGGAEREARQVLRPRPQVLNCRTLTWISVRIHTTHPTRSRARPAVQCADGSEASHSHWSEQPGGPPAAAHHGYGMHHAAVARTRFVSERFSS